MTETKQIIDLLEESMFNTILETRPQRKLEIDRYQAKKILSELNNVLAILEPFNGSKVVKVDNYWTKKFDEAIEPIREHRKGQTENTAMYKAHTQHFAISKQYKSLYIEFKVWAVWNTYEDFRSDNGSYETMLVNIGRLEDEQTLELIEPDIESLRTLINREWEPIEATLAKRAELLEQIKALESSIPYYSYK